MKFLVLSLCVCAASAASVFGNNPYLRGRQQQQGARRYTVNAAPTVANAVPNLFVDSAYNAANAIATGSVVAAKAVVTAPVVAAKAVLDAPAAAAQAIYNTGKNVYNNGNEAEAPILRSENEVSAEGYNYIYETGNGISGQSSGQLKNVDNKPVLVQQGSYRYTAPDGQIIEVTYVADENGYNAKSDAIPVGPAIPEEILRSLKFIADHPTKPENY